MPVDYDSQQGHRMRGHIVNRYRGISEETIGDGSGQHWGFGWDECSCGRSWHVQERPVWPTLAQDMKEKPHGT